MSYSFDERPFKVDGVAIPTPSTYKYQEEDLSSEETGRTLDGTMHKDVVAVKTYYDCTWTKLSWEDAATLISAISGKTKVTFTHADPKVPGTFITGNFYIGKRSSAAMNLKDEERTWGDISFQFIEI